MNGFDFSGGTFGIGDWTVQIGAGGYPVNYPYPPTGGYPYPGPVYNGGVVTGNQTQQVLMIGLIVLAFLVLSKR